MRQTIGDLSDVLGHIDNSSAQFKHRHRRVIELELDSLRSLDQELSQGAPSLRSWSLGQASIPILNSMLNAVRRSAVEVPDSSLNQARQSVSNLASALERWAEGRD